METCCPLYRYLLLHFYHIFFYYCHLWTVFITFCVFIQASGQQIPVVVQSCVCFINLNGAHMTLRTQ